MNISPFKLEEYFARYEFTSPYVLCASDCETVSIGELLSLGGGQQESLTDLRLGYTETFGNLQLREQIAALYEEISASQVLVHCGGEEPIFNFINSTLQPGDHIVVHWPAYQSLFEVARASGVEVTMWETNEKNSWELDVNFLKDHIRSNTKVVIVNSPHNPTGYLLTRETQQEIDQLSREFGFIVFSDEIYRFSEYRLDDRLTPWCDLNENAVSLGGMSKAFGLPGLRIGWIATRNRDVYERMASFKNYTTICNSAPSEFLATVALRNKDTIVNRNVQIISANLEQLNRFFRRYEHIFNWRIPKAGPIAFPSLRSGEDTSKFCHELVTQAGILLLPGSIYGLPRSSNFRIGFGRKNLPTCLGKLEQFLDVMEKSSY
jgi:aspartate/methionine/tyrosine aminotransferase